MPRANHYKDIIKMLHTGNFFIECNQCSEELPLKKQHLFDNDNFSDEAWEIYDQQLQMVRDKKAELKRLREIGTTRSEIGALSVNIGLILERLAPTMPAFPFNHNDCRSVFDPIDYVIFEGLTKKGRVDKIYLIDIKSGNAKLSPRQKEIKAAINNKKIKFKKF
jgi:predicted Holliday junction resolvase-like endonuclease